MSRRWGVLGAPSSAAGHWPGMELAPGYLRDGGLLDGLRASGAEAKDFGDLEVLRWRPDDVASSTQNLQVVAPYVDQIAQRTRDIVADGWTPLVLGGECTVSLGAMAGLSHVHGDLGILYFDGHLDLNTPRSSQTGILDGMGLAQMLGDPDAIDALRAPAARDPLLTPSQVVSFGHVVSDMNAIEVQTLDRLRLTTYPWDVLSAGDIEALATEALGCLEGRASTFFLHFDVDAIRFLDMPIANVPIRRQGLTLAQAIAALRVFAASPRLVGAAVTEINPHHNPDPDGAAVLAAALTSALGPGSR